MLQPTRLISTPFAQEGEKTQIQNVTGEFDNSATYRLGFPPLTMQSIRLGGKPPKGTDFNGVLFDITENISFLCKGGRYQYNEGLSTLIGGYPEGSNLLLDDNITEVVSTVAGNQNNPNTDMTGWTFKPNGATAEYVLDASGETQQQVNYNGGAKWHSRVGGYKENERVVLTNGDIVKSTVDGNTNDPNVDMTGWVPDFDTSAIQAEISTINTELLLKADTNYVDNQLTLKADTTYVDDAVGAISTDASKQYATLALANADIANIALNQNVFVSEETNGGYWYKATEGATSLTKSPFDPLTQSKAYTDQNITILRSDIGENNVMSAATSTIDATFTSLDAAFIDGVLVSGTLPPDFRIQNFPSKATVDAGMTNATITLRGNGLNYNSAQFTIPAGGAKVELTFNNVYFIAKFYVDFTKSPITAVNNNTAPYYLDVDMLSVKQNMRDFGYFARQSQSKLRSYFLATTVKIPQEVENYLNDTFNNPIAFYPDLSMTAGAVPTNSNQQDPDYTLSYHLTNPSAYMVEQDSSVGIVHKYTVSYGASPTELLTISNIFKACEMIVGVKIDPSLIKSTEFVVRNGSGADDRYSFFTGLVTTSNNAHVTASLISSDMDTGYFVWKISITPDLAVNSSSIQSITARNTSTTGTFDVSIYRPIVSDKINYPVDIPYSKTKNSPWIGKNLMFFGDSNSRGNIAIEAMKQIGCNVYWNAAGGRSMQYRGVAEGDSDKGWLYHWTRRSHIKNLYDANKMLDLFLFNASYNDTSGGGTLSDAAVQAVLDNYPTLQDDSATVDAKLAIFNALTVQQRKDIFGYKQTFAAYLLQIIQMFPQAKIFLTTMLYSPASIDGTGTTSGTVNQQRAYDKAKRDAINADIRAIAAWYGVSVIDVNSNAGYYYGNMTTYTSDTIHFDEVVGKRIGHYTAKNILMQTQ